MLIADLRAVAVQGLMSRAGVVDRYPRRGLQAGAQHVTVFSKEVVLAFGQQPLDLTLGDRHANRLQQRRQTGQRRLALVVLHQHEATQVGAEVYAGTLGQWRNDRSAVRRDPTLAPVADRMYRQHQVLDGIGLVAFEARSGRDSGLDDPILNTDTGADLAASSVLPCPVGLGRFGALIHAAGFDVGTPLQPLQARNLLALFDIFLFQFDYLGQQHGHQLPQLGRRQLIEVGWWDHT